MVVSCCCSPLPCSRLPLDQQSPLLLQLISLSGDLLLTPTWGRGGENGSRAVAQYHAFSMHVIFNECSVCVGGGDSLVQPGEGSPILPCLHILSSLSREGRRERREGREGEKGGEGRGGDGRGGEEREKAVEGGREGGREGRKGGGKRKRRDRDHIVM